MIKVIAKKYNVKIIPTIIFFKNGKEIDRFKGYQKGMEKSELEARIKKYYLNKK
ncbi:MAG: thioredoxin family protein [Candidatus Pacearchaeota archaeon]